ncbi:3-isopropylmalate dehydrogenase [Alternaria tenuissima]|uniref:3-isopropylmalate dehydrogenase n=2 Tax=Alternaria alternata complex TaxID=187734 RepID=A0A4Q4MZU1_ALTAL|nr:3-isopropylmalate dehydrogenase [Alternaria alternata]RYN85711.1 3-isopropylmalate dehydrogenase [Alternaria tenuissima]
MMTAHTIVVFGGDYCGPEVMKEGLKVLSEIEHQNPDVKFELIHHLIGGAAWDVHGENITVAALSDATSASAVLLGAVGGPKWAKHAIPVEWGLGRLRKALDAFGNLRPVNFAAPSLISRSSLKPKVCTGTEILIVRELTGGVYFGPRSEHDGSFDQASDTDVYTRKEIERVTRLAGSLAMARDPPLAVTSLDKANVLAACGRLWRGVVSEVMAAEFPEIELRHMLIDSAAMVMALNPTKLNGVVLASNMFGDIISDQASAIPGSIGLLPSASLCSIPERGQESSRIRGLYEPIHGSAPDIAGKGIVNPVGMILSVAMMCRLSLDMGAAATSIEAAVRDTLEAGICTPDIGGTASTSEVGDAVVAALVRISDKH